MVVANIILCTNVAQMATLHAKTASAIAARKGQRSIRVIVRPSQDFP